MSTIKDVAKAAGVSVSTVSYAMSGARPISAATKAVIERAMQDLNYSPHAIARSLASKKTRIIAILFPAVERGIGLSELSLITNAAKAAIGRGYHLVLWSTRTNEPEELEALTSHELVDGVLLMEVHNNDTRIPLLRGKGIPFMLFGRSRSAEDESFVDTDFAVTMYKALAYLSGLGHRNICFINQAEETYRSGYGPVVRTHDAFTVFSADLRLEGESSFCSSNPSEGYLTTRRLLSDYPETTAFIVMNDKTLSGVIKAVEESGKKIPGDISVVALVSSEATATLFLPQLTTYEMEGTELMELAVGQLIAKIEKTYFEVPQRLLPCTLVERDSSGPAPHT